MIDWKGIVNNAVSVLVAAVFVGAAAIVWNKVTTIDNTVSQHTSKLRGTQNFIINTQSELKAGQTALTDNIVGLQGEIEKLNKQIISLQQIIKEIEKSKTSKYSIPDNKPFILPQYKVDDVLTKKLKKDEEEKIRTKIQSLTPSYQPLYQDQLEQQVQREILR